MTDSYYGRPYLKAPVWKPDVAGYFWIGGLAGASATLALAARLAGNRRLHRNALGAALAGSVISPVLLVDDLGRPERFLNMLRVFKPTSPMSVGSWTLAGFGTAAGGAAVSEFTGFLRPLGRLAEVVAAALGPVLATYTGVLVANTAIPVWHESRRHLPLLFAGGAMASAGGLAAITTPARRAGPARRLAVLGAGLELASAADMERRLGELAATYREGEAAQAARASRGLTAAGAALMVLTGRRRVGAILAGSLLMGGALAGRVAVFRAGMQSARETKPNRPP
jgi:DMSO reductase anchor subunit